MRVWVDELTKHELIHAQQLVPHKLALDEGMQNVRTVVVKYFWPQNCSQSNNYLLPYAALTPFFSDTFKEKMSATA